MKNILLPLLFLCLSKPLGVWAQENTTPEPLPRYRITTLPTQFLVSELIINVEKIKPKSSVGLLLGYRFKGLTESEEVGWEGIIEHTHLDIEYQGVLAGINTKSFFSARRTWYWDFQAFVRHWWLNSRNDYTDYLGDHIVSKSQYNVEVVGIKVLLGKTYYLGHTGTTRPVLSLYTGLGVRAKFHHDWGKKTSNGVSQPRRNDLEAQALPTFHLGFTVGVEKFAKTVSAAD